MNGNGNIRARIPEKISSLALILFGMSIPQNYVFFDGRWCTIAAATKDTWLHWIVLPIRRGRAEWTGFACASTRRNIFYLIFQFPFLKVGSLSHRVCSPPRTIQKCRTSPARSEKKCVFVGDILLVHCVGVSLRRTPLINHLMTRRFSINYC